MRITANKNNFPLATARKFHHMSMLCLIAFAIMLNISGCKKLVDVEAPLNSTSTGNAFASDVTATAVLNGIYTQLSTDRLSSGIQLTGFTSLYCGLSADELVVDPSVDNNLKFYFTNSLFNTSGPFAWSACYLMIYQLNTAIIGLEASNTLSPQVKNQLLGQALMLRAWHYFYLTNLYGDVPLVLGTDFKVNTNLSRSSQASIYAQIIADLQQAEPLVSAAYLSPDAKTASSERVIPNKAAVQAMLARAYLFAGNYPLAESAANRVIAQSSLYSLPALNQVFLSGSKEAIWQLQPVNLERNTEDAWTFVLPASGPDPEHPVYLSDFLINAFEAGDKRRQDWVGSLNLGGQTYYYPYKYKSADPGDPVTEYKMVFRLAEVHLIRAEALAQQNKLAAAATDLNLIRSRAGLSATTASTQSALLAAIAHERQVELFTEYGDRWINLKRTKTIDQVMPAVCTAKGGSWKSSAQLYPIPLDDLIRAPKLTQNPGY
ncbi:RagB/SusD family nutrient uptake outer membrane protein [Pedobacter aquatilis]|uniref:RagB/SusD family nutrient uptake outer membrane protein n=1 Tax=Pedobacter aquatilis TaxID=351343 RepID=UPI0029314CD2|nr:RagB/SusD family nutrient uptake outer membrane protein [Pedobacter aquatilis]